MLIIARKEQQAIVITTPEGDTITVVVAEIRGRNQVAIGVEAPQRIKIMAGEKVEEHPEEKIGRPANCYYCGEKSPALLVLRPHPGGVGRAVCCLACSEKRKGGD